MARTQRASRIVQRRRPRPKFRLGQQVVELNGKRGVVAEIVYSHGYIVRGRGCSKYPYQEDELEART